MAHLEGTLNGMMMIAVTAAAKQLTLCGGRSSMITGGLVAIVGVILAFVVLALAAFSQTAD